MPRPAAALFVLLASLPASAAMRLGPGPRTEAVTADSNECSDSESYEKVGDDCYDSTGELVAEGCCKFVDICREEVMALSQACATHIQNYMQGCDLLPDVSAEGSYLKLVDNTRICSEKCQGHAEFVFQESDVLRDVEHLEEKCSHQLDSIRAVIQAVQHLDFEWKSCSLQPEEDKEQPVGEVKLGESMKGPLHKAQIMKPSPAPPKKPRWGPVTITIHWVQPVINLKTAFETLWTALPVTYSEEFRIRGTVGAIQEELLLRPSLPITCPTEHVGKPVYLVVSKIQKTNAQVYMRAWVSGFANMAGIGTFALSAPASFRVGGAGLRLASQLAANPTQMTLDKVVDYMMDHVHRHPKRSLRKLWRWLGHTRNEAFLTLGDPERKRHVGHTIMFQCNLMTINGKEKAYATWVDGAEMHTIVTAKHLAFLITSLA